MDRAPDGPWIAASEWAFRDAFLQRMKESYQASVQSKVDAHPPSKSGAGGSAPLRNKGEPPVHVLTIGGDIEQNRRYLWSKVGGGVFPVDALIGITVSKASLVAREACSTMGVVHDFAQGAVTGDSYGTLSTTKMTALNLCPVCP